MCPIRRISPSTRALWSGAPCITLWRARGWCNDARKWRKSCLVLVEVTDSMRDSTVRIAQLMWASNVPFLLHFYPHITPCIVLGSVLLLGEASGCPWPRPRCPHPASLLSQQAVGHPSFDLHSSRLVACRHTGSCVCYRRNRETEMIAGDWARVTRTHTAASEFLLTTNRTKIGNRFLNACAEY